MITFSSLSRQLAGRHLDSWLRGVHEGYPTFGGGGEKGVKNFGHWKKKISIEMGGGCVKNAVFMRTSFINGPLSDSCFSII